MSRWRSNYLDSYSRKLGLLFFVRGRSYQAISSRAGILRRCCCNISGRIIDAWPTAQPDLSMKPLFLMCRDISSSLENDQDWEIKKCWAVHIQGGLLL